MKPVDNDNAAAGRADRRATWIYSDSQSARIRRRHYDAYYVRGAFRRRSRDESSLIAGP